MSEGSMVAGFGFGGWGVVWVVVVVVVVVVVKAADSGMQWKVKRG
jgi:hypothetical protein